MNELQKEFENVFKAIPDVLPANLTFMEIAGYPHYENVCSNILKFYFNTANKLHGLDDLLLRSLLEVVGEWGAPFKDSNHLEVRRELSTNTGRIDIVIYNKTWVVAIENKIRHTLNNDLEEYSDFLEEEFAGRKIIKVVLSLRSEAANLSGGFVNVIYKTFFQQIDRNLSSYKTDPSNQYLIFFYHFAQTIKNLYMPVQMEKSEIDFLINNQDKIERIIELENKLNSFINQKANNIEKALAIDESMGKLVYDGHNVVVIYRSGDTAYKVEYIINKSGHTIYICVEPNKVDKIALKKLDYFKINDIEKYRYRDDNNRLIIEEGIDFYTSDDEATKKLQNLLTFIKVSEN